jgi:2'-5' RNA ligase
MDKPKHSSSPQLSLDGFDANPHPTDRLFFALQPDAATARRIAQLGQQLQRKLHLEHSPLLRTERFHITLHHIGDFVGVPPDIERKARQAADALTGWPPFDLQLDRAGSFPGRPGNRPFVLKGAEDEVAELIAFQDALGQALLRQGLRGDSGFTPHVTLLYDRLELPDHFVEPVGWRASQFVLIHSLLGKTQYVQLGAWALGQ